MANLDTLNASSKIMVMKAKERGITCQIFNDQDTVMMEKDGQRWYTRGSRTSWQSSVGKTIADYKPLTKEILQHFQLPTAKSVTLTTSADVVKLKEVKFPVVVKPVDERHGTGVVVGVPDVETVQTHFEKQKPLLVEEQLQGLEYRIVCVDFKFVAAAFRKPAHVTGDGQKTIQELIDIKNQHPWRGEGHQNFLSLIKVDELVMKLLDSQSMTLESIPAKEQVVLLRQTANLSTGGEAWDVTAEVGVENVKLFEQIAKVCDLNVVGIDMMCDSLKTPIIEQAHAGVIEVNASPGLRMHHYPIQGHAQDVAGKILDMVEKKLQETQRS